MIGDARVIARSTARSDMSNMPEQGSLSSLPRGNTALSARSKGIDRTRARIFTCFSQKSARNLVRIHIDVLARLRPAPLTPWQIVNVFACSRVHSCYSDSLGIRMCIIYQVTCAVKPDASSTLSSMSRSASTLFGTELSAKTPLVSVVDDALSSCMRTRPSSMTTRPMASYR